MVPSLFQVVADDILIRCRGKGNRGSSVLIEDSIRRWENRKVFWIFGGWTLGIGGTSVRVGGAFGLLGAGSTV